MTTNLYGDYARTCSDCNYSAAGQKSDVDRLFRKHRKVHDAKGKTAGKAAKVEASKAEAADVEVAPESFVDSDDPTPATDTETPSVDV